MSNVNPGTISVKHRKTFERVCQEYELALKNGLHLGFGDLVKRAGFQYG